MRHVRWYAPLLVVLLVSLDQIAKYLAWSILRVSGAVVLIPNIFELSYLENESAAFGIDPVSIVHKLFHIAYFDENPEAFLRCKMVFFAVLTIAVTLFLIWLYCKVPRDRHFLPMEWMLLLFLSGAFGNLIDRVWHHYVIDFFYFRLIDFPIFNIADIYVTVAAGLAVILGIFFYSEEDFDQVFPGQKGREREEDL